MYYVKKEKDGNEITLIIRLPQSKIGFTYPDALLRINDDCYYMDFYLSTVMRSDIETCQNWLEHAEPVDNEKFKELKVFNIGLDELCDYLYNSTIKMEANKNDSENHN